MSTIHLDRADLAGVRSLERQPAMLIDGVVYVYVGRGEWNSYSDPSGDFGYASPIDGEDLTRLMDQEDAAREQWEAKKRGDAGA